jgi:heat-inducible transcriptional repressor
VDSLLTVKPLNAREIARIRHQLSYHQQGDVVLLETASSLLSGITRMASVVMMPRRERSSLRQIEFLSMSGNRVLAILVTDDDEVHNRIIETRRRYSPAELEQAANYLNQAFSGRDIDEVREKLLRDLEEARNSMDRIMARAVEMGGKALAPSDAGDDCMIAGQTNLMEFDELADMERLRQLFDAFTEKQQILQLLDECMKAEGMHIFIGEESGYKLLDSCSVVTAPYRLQDRVVGVLGVIGPTRMAYERVIPLVDVTAKLLGAALKHR